MLCTYKYPWSWNTPRPTLLDGFPIPQAFCCIILHPIALISLDSHSPNWRDPRAKTAMEPTQGTICPPPAKKLTSRRAHLHLPSSLASKSQCEPPYILGASPPFPPPLLRNPFPLLLPHLLSSSSITLCDWMNEGRIHLSRHHDNFRLWPEGDQYPRGGSRGWWSQGEVCGALDPGWWERYVPIREAARPECMYGGRCPINLSRKTTDSTQRNFRFISIMGFAVVLMGTWEGQLR